MRTIKTGSWFALFTLFALEGMNLRRLEAMHPAVSFAYLLAIMLLTAVSGNPIMVMISLLGAVISALLSDRHGLFPVIIGAVCVAAANFIFVHKGNTPLFFSGDTAFTLEALLYGVYIGMMLSAVCVWGSGSVKYVTSDKYIWLFGRIFPAAGLVLSCAMRFVPLFIRRTQEFISVQSAASRYADRRERPGIRDYLSAFSASLGYSAEQAMDSSLSMRARGYGTTERTSFSLYRFNTGAALALAVVLLTAGTSAVLIFAGAGNFRYYPELSQLPMGAADIALYVSFLIFCLLPSAVIITE